MKIIRCNRQLGNLLYNLYYHKEVEWIILICEHNLTGLPFVAKCLVGPRIFDNVIKLAIFFEMDIAEQYARFIADNELIVEVTVKDHLDSAIIDVVTSPVMKITGTAPVPLDPDDDF